ncbi:hypothetical protein BGZ83_005274, partial [Gryganskiella cystojenkinii]
MYLRISTATAVFTLLVVISILLPAKTVDAHVGLKFPCARGSPLAGCPKPSAGQTIDYDLNSPIGTHDSKNSPICKNIVPSQTRTKIKAGASISTQYNVGASHGGGHCQWALSYDGGKTWVVLKTVLRSCLKGISQGGQYSVSVPIPKTAPNGNAVFMWLWNNAQGNRELYSNCADITIENGANGGSLSGLVPLIANYGSGSLLIPEFPLPSSPADEADFGKRKAITVNVS